LVVDVETPLRMEPASLLEERITDRSAVVGVVGLGYVEIGRAHV